jgi:hypothetical protein
MISELPGPIPIHDPFHSFFLVVRKGALEFWALAGTRFRGHKPSNSGLAVVFVFLDRESVRLNPFRVYEPTGYEFFGRGLEWSTDTNNPEGFAFLFLESSYFYALVTSFGIVPDLVRELG